MTKSRIDLEGIYVTSGVNERGEGFCTVAAHGNDGKTVLLGQLDPATVRRMAMDWIESAEAAEQDAAVYRVLSHVMEGRPDEAKQMAAIIITELRESRGDQK